jgi:phasin family protein
MAKTVKAQSKGGAKPSKSAKAGTRARKRVNANVKVEQVKSASAAKAKTKSSAGNVVFFPGLEQLTETLTGLELPRFEFPAFNLCGMESIMPKQNFEFEKFTQEAVSASREQVEAFIKFQTTLTKGVEDIVRTAASLTQSAAEKQAEYTKQIMGAKTLNELSVAQNKITKASFDEFMAGATKLSEMSVKVINESVAPLNDQMAKGMQKATKMAA